MGLPQGLPVNPNPRLSSPRSLPGKPPLEHALNTDKMQASRFEMILRPRCAVHRRAVGDILAGQFPVDEDLVSPTSKHFMAIEHFMRWMQELQAGPKVHVAYEREAYVPRDGNAARLTFDRNVRSARAFDLPLSTARSHPVVIGGKAVVLELKFTDRFPNWFRELVSILGVHQCGAAQYADGVTLLGAQRPWPTVARDVSQDVLLTSPLPVGDTAWPLHSPGVMSTSG